MIKKIGATISKNLKLILRSKISTIIIFLGPFILLLLLGIGIKAEMSDISVGFHLSTSEDEHLFDSLSDIKNDHRFNFIPYDDIDNCIKDVQTGRIHLCLNFNSSSEQRVAFYVDIAKTNLAYVILDSLSSIFNEKSKAIGVDTIKEILSQIILISDQISNKTDDLNSMKKEIYSLPYKIREIKSGLAEISFDVNLDYSRDFKEIDDSLSDYSSKSHSEINRINKDLDETRVDINKSLESLYEKRDNRDKLVIELDDAFELNNCSIKDYIFIDVDSDDFNSNNFDLPEGVDPYCSSVYSAKKTYVSETNDIDDSIIMLKKFDAKIVVTQKNLYVYKRDIDSSLTDAQNKLSGAKKQLQTLKQSLNGVSSFKDNTANDLDDAELILNKSISEIDSMLDAMSVMSDNLSQISVEDANAIINPIRPKYKLFNVATNRLEALFESMLTLVVGFTCILLASLIITQERNSSANFRNSLIKLPYVSIILGTIITVTIISLIQANIFLLLGKFMFDINGLNNLFLLNIIIVLGSVLFSSIGILIGTLIDSQENVILVSIITTLGMFLVSGIFIPREFFKEFLNSIVNTNPFILFEGALKYIIIYNQIDMFLNFIGIVLLEIVVIVFITLIAHHFKKRVSF